MVKIVKIYGGLGNQMFQYAFGKALENAGEKVRYDVSWFKKNKSGTIRSLGLGAYKLKLKKSNFFYRFLCSKVKEKETNVFEPELLSLQGCKYYVGYFQSERYFANYREQLVQDFQLSYPLNKANQDILEKIKNTNSVSLHVRRGDYVKLAHIYDVCSAEYYSNAIKYIAEHVEKPHFFLFSDDIDWVRENMQPDFPCEYVGVNDGDSGYFDIELMKNCKHNIIANSTFAWWGAWLNPHKDKIVIMPKVWFADGSKTSITDVDWMKL